MEEKIIKSIRRYIDVNIPIILIENFDYVRVDAYIAKAIGTDSKKVIVEWNPASGVTDFKSKVPFGGKMSGAEGDTLSMLQEYLFTIYAPEHSHSSRDFVVLRDIHDFINDPKVKSLLSHIAQRRMYDMAWDEDTNEYKYRTTIFLSCPHIDIPEELKPYVGIVEVPYPDESVIESIIDEHIRINKFDKGKFDRDDLTKLMPSLKGLSLFEIDRMLDVAFSKNGSLGEKDSELLMGQKKSLVRKSGLLDLVETKENLKDIGGLENLKDYLKRKSEIMKKIHLATKHKVAVPKGVFIVGMPGCGKSLSAKAAAAQFGVPLLKLDMGSLMGKYVGQSEANLRQAIKIAESAAPCILWIDEIEKGFSGLGGKNGGGNDIMTRMFGYFLSWLQDKTSAVYVIATANNANNLPPELKRKGRFDEIFCVYLPNEAERREIFRVHLRNKEQSDVIVTKTVVDKTKDYNGADIEAVVNYALEHCFMEAIKDKDEKDLLQLKIQLKEKDLLDAIVSVKSIYASCQSQIDAMDKVFKENNFTNAST